MARKSMIVKASRKPKFKVREYTRCNRCGRPHAVLKKYGVCRICFRYNKTGWQSSNGQKRKKALYKTSKSRHNKTRQFHTLVPELNCLSNFRIIWHSAKGF